MISSKAEMNARVYDVPTSSILINGKRANYYKVITSLEYKDCNAAIKRIVPRINLEKINDLIDNTEELSQLQRDFIKKILKLRKEIILDAAFKKL
ncbi:MAG: hypothetical protein SOV58_05865 [Candidatus Enteromonas sp.]|nr:hypothetical protein [Candidatus Enteromonas sp.]